MAEEFDRPTERFAIDKAGNRVKFQDRVKDTQLDMVGRITTIRDDGRVCIRYDWIIMTKEQFKEVFIKI